VIGAGFNSLSETNGLSGWDANLRINIPLGGRLQICPGLGFEFKTEEFAVENIGDLTTRTGSASAGLGFGFEQQVFKGVSLIPFAAVDYQFSAIVYSLDTPDNSEDELSGDTLSHFNITYGGLVKYKALYAGVSAERYSDTEGSRPYRARLLVGFAFGGGSRSSRESSMARPAGGDPTRR
jgi:hypothetical protein